MLVSSCTKSGNTESYFFFLFGLIVLGETEQTEVIPTREKRAHKGRQEKVAGILCDIHQRGPHTWVLGALHHLRMVKGLHANLPCTLCGFKV